MAATVDDVADKKIPVDPGGHAILEEYPNDVLELPVRVTYDDEPRSVRDLDPLNVRGVPPKRPGHHQYLEDSVRGEHLEAVDVREVVKPPAHVWPPAAVGRRVALEKFYELLHELMGRAIQQQVVEAPPSGQLRHVQRGHNRWEACPGEHVAHLVLMVRFDLHGKVRESRPPSLGFKTGACRTGASKTRARGRTEVWSSARGGGLLPRSGIERLPETLLWQVTTAVRG
mmetsp:Transcript_19534/g.53485  ORF Transcript_19534/g.53485 Transcript_19534/m.53485 type:complete len:228 (+) Transcript_19534:2016-2699(+)